MPDTARSFRALLRPDKVRNAVRRRWFEHRMARVPLAPTELRVEDVGTPYGGWMLPAGMVTPEWTCYCVGTGADISFDLTLLDLGATVRAFEPVEQFAQDAREAAGDRPRYTVDAVAIALRDGPLSMQRNPHPGSGSLAASDLHAAGHEGHVEVPGRTFASVMAAHGDTRIDLLKLDVEGFEYDLLDQIDLGAMGVRVFAVQLHHTVAVSRARALVAALSRQGYALVAQRPVVKLTFVRDPAGPGA